MDRVKSHGVYDDSDAEIKTRVYHESKRFSQFGIAAVNFFVCSSARVGEISVTCYQESLELLNYVLNYSFNETLACWLYTTHEACLNLVSAHHLYAQTCNAWMSEKCRHATKSGVSQARLSKNNAIIGEYKKHRACHS